MTQLHGEVLGVVVFNGGNDCLNKLEEDDEVHVDSKFASAIGNSLNNFLHYFGVSAGMNRSHRRTGYVRMSLHCHGSLGVILRKVLVHLIHRERVAILLKIK